MRTEPEIPNFWTFLCQILRFCIDSFKVRSFKVSEFDFGFQILKAEKFTVSKSLNYFFKFQSSKVCDTLWRFFKMASLVLIEGREPSGRGCNHNWSAFRNSFKKSEKMQSSPWNLRILNFDILKLWSDFSLKGEPYSR